MCIWEKTEAWGRKKKCIWSQNSGQGDIEAPSGSADMAVFIADAWLPAWGPAGLVHSDPGSTESLRLPDTPAADVMFISKQRLWNLKIDTQRVSMVPS